MYNPQVVDILLRQQGKKSKDLAKALTGNERYPLSNLTKEGANPTAETLEKMANFFLVAIDTFFVRTTELPDVPQVWTFDNRAVYYERGMVAKDGIIQTLNFDREVQAGIIEKQREAIANLEDLNSQLKELLKEHNIPIPRPKPTQHTEDKSTYVVEGANTPFTQKVTNEPK